MYEPCSPSEKGAVEATLTQLAEKGLASQVSLLRHRHGLSCSADLPHPHILGNVADLSSTA